MRKEALWEVTTAIPREPEKNLFYRFIINGSP